MSNSYPYLAFSRCHSLNYGTVLNAIDDVSLRAEFPPDARKAFEFVNNLEKTRQRNSLAEHLARQECLAKCPAAACVDGKQCKALMYDTPGFYDKMVAYGWSLHPVEAKVTKVGPGGLFQDGSH